MRLTRVLAAFVAMGLAADAEGQAAATAPVTPVVRQGRIVGVFDDATGQPLTGAQVEDVFTGWSATTSATGTVSLFYVDTGGTLLRIKKVGYVPQTFPVANSVRDTTPITIVLKAAAQLLPSSVTRVTSSRGPADTVRKLDLAGFYERRNSQGAPTRAFVTTKELEKVRLVSDVVRFSGRLFCKDNLYIDGIKVQLPDLNLGGRRTTKLLKDGIDALIEPSMVAGIEMYKVADVPAQYNATSINRPCGATLIWTK